MKKSEMNNLNQVNQPVVRGVEGPLSFRAAFAFKVAFISGLLLLTFVLASPAANVMLKTSDALGTSSITGSTNWSNGAVPTAGNTYFTTNAAGAGLLMRTPTGLANNVFAGDALVLCTNITGASLTIKGDQGSVITINNLIMVGGSVANGASAANAATTNTLAGFINIVANSRFDAGGAGRAIVVAAAITNGTSTLAITNAGSIWLFGTNYGFTGKTVVDGGCSLRITNQFNLGSNPSNFTADQILLDNGILSVTNSLSLNDPNRGITLTTNGGKFDVASGATLTLPNPIVGAGSLTKTSAGTLILSGANTYTNGTIVSAGVLSVQNSFGLGTNGTVNQASGSRNSTIQLQGNISLPSAVKFTLSNDGTVSPVTNAIENISGNNTINGAISLTTGGGSAAIQSDSGALVLAGNIGIASGQSSRGVILEGVSTAANTVAGNILDLSSTSVDSVIKNGIGTWILSGTNSYSGPTTINGGTLALSGSGSISNTPLISIASGAIFDVSGLSSLFTLGSGQSISNSAGTINGSFATTAGSSIYPAGAGIVGTLTCNNNLNLGAGGTVAFDLSATAASGNDQIVVGGGLILSSSDYIHINAMSGSLDTADYVLFSVSAGTTMSTTPVLIWDGTVPGNYLNYSLLQVGNNVVLHYSSSIAPSVTASVNPTSVARNQAVTVTATVTAGSGSIASVTTDLSQIGGSSTGGLVLDSVDSTPPTYIYTNTFLVAAGTTLGNKSLTVTATDNSSPTPLTGTYIISTLTVNANAVTWDGDASDNKWTSNANWTGDVGPGLVGDSVTFSGTTQLLADMNTNYNLTSLTFDGTAGPFTIGSSVGGTLTIGGGILNNSTSSQTLNVPVVISAAQTFSPGFGNVILTTNLSLGANALTVNGSSNLVVEGVVSGTGSLTMTSFGGLVLSNNNTFSGGITLTTGTLAIGNDLAIGTGRLDFNGGTFQSVDGTAHTITNAINFDGSAGANTTFGGTGNLKFTGSAVNGTSKTLTVNNPVTELSGVLSGASARTVAGTGTLLLSGANTYSTGTIINQGATLQLGNGGTNGLLSTSGTIDDEGTLIINRSNAVVQGVDFSATPIFGAGSFVQSGSGTTTLNGANTYSGSTIVNNGELFITPASQANGNVTVADGAKFGVATGSVTNNATIGNLTLGNTGATTLDFSYGFAGNPTNAVLVANAVVVNGACTIRVGGSFVTGTFPVLRYSSLAGSFVSTVVGPRGVTASVLNDAVNRILYVTISSVGSGIVWTGTNSVSPNLWDLNTTTNWLIGGQPTVYLETVPPGDAVTFNDQGSGLVLLSNTVSPGSVTLSNTSVNYTFQGTGQINSLDGLTEVGGGTVTMNVPGTFSGSTVISNSTFNIGASQTFANLSGNGTVTVSSGSPTLTINDSLNTAFSGSISGALTLAKTGSGVLTIAGSDSFSGNLFVSSGMLLLNSGSISANNYCSIGHSGTDNGTLTLEGTAGFTTTSDFNVGDIGSAVGIFNIQDTASLTANAFYVGSANATSSTASGTVNQTSGTVTELNTTAGTFSIGGRTSGTSTGGVGTYNLIGGTLNAASAIRVGAVGNGTFEQSNGVVLASAGVDIASVAGSVGTYNFDGGTLTTLNIVSSSGANSTMNFNGGVLVPTGNNSTFVTNVALVEIRNGGMIVNTTNFNVTVSTMLQHSTIGGDNAIDGGLTKLGSGILNVAGGGSSYTGPTIVTAGTLNFSAGSIASLNNLTLNNATLGIALSGGTVSIPASGLTLSGNSTLNLNYDQISGTPVTAINSSGSLAAFGTTTINVTGYGWTAEQVPLISYTGTPLANLNNFVLGALPYGVTASLSNNVANMSIDLVVTSVSITTWIPLIFTDPVGTSSFDTAGFWQNGNPPTAGNGYFTRIYALRSPADTNAYSFAGSVLSVDTVGRFIMKGVNGQVMTVNNLVMNGGLVDYANAGDNFIETLAGNITLQGGMTSYLGALGSTGLSETLFVNAPIGGSGNLQIGGFNVNNGADVGVVVLAATNNYSGTTTVATGTLQVNGVNGNSAITVAANATLEGMGSVGGTVNVQTGGILEPGVAARGALTNAIGTLTAGGATSVSGSVVMKISPGVSPSNDEFVAPAITVNSNATLTVANIGSANFVAGETFTLFSTPINGAFSSVTLPALSGTNLFWTNNLAVNGSITVVSTSSTINPNSTNIIASVSGNSLTLSWPADHLGWLLQVQTNSLGGGLGTNWFTIPGSGSVTSTNLTIDPSIGSVFYRMVYP